MLFLTAIYLYMKSYNHHFFTSGVNMSGKTNKTRRKKTADEVRAAHRRNEQRLQNQQLESRQKDVGMMQNIRNQILAMIRPHLDIATLLRNTETMACIENPGEFKACVTLFTNDLGQFVNNFKAMDARFSQLNAAQVKGDAWVLECIDIYNGFTQLLEHYQNNMLVPAADILSAIEDASIRAVEKKKQTVAAAEETQNVE